MRLASPSGASVELDIDSYEQPPPAEPTSGEQGGDWLVVRGDCVDAAGRRWAFADACLDTDDALELHRWLVGVAESSIEPSAAPGRGPHLLAFAEPDLCMCLIAHEADRRVIRFSFLGDAAPRWSTDFRGRSKSVEGYTIELEVTAADVELAAAEWKRHVDAYPNR